MQKKFTIKKNSVKVRKAGDAVNEESLSTGIARKSLSDELHINIISTASVDTSNLYRLSSPIEAEKKKSGITGVRKKRRATRNLELKSAPPIPTAPTDAATRKRNFIVSQIKSHLYEIDLPFCLFVLILSAIGLIGVFSATLSFDSYKFILVQGFGIFLGVFCAVVLSFIDYRQLASKYRYIIAINAAILIITFIFGQSVTEATNANWIDLGIIKIQPSEFAKLLFIFTFAVHLTQLRDKMHKFSTVIFLILHAGIIFGLVLLQRDLGSLTIFIVIFVSMCFAAGLSFWYYIFGACAIVCVSPFLWARLSEYQRNRIMLCFDSTIDPEGIGIRYQQLRSVTAIGNGGIFGTGFTKGTVTQGLSDHLPAKHTDMIFSTLCEEWGLIGAIIILLITSFIIFRALKIALNCSNTTGRYICVGIASMLMIQVIENVGMCLGIMPVIGITYPFLSYGGSSILSCFIAAGFVMSVSTHSEKTFFSGK